jgi:hypothetical protein
VAWSWALVGLSAVAVAQVLHRERIVT